MNVKLCRVFDHQNKSAAYREALAAAGYAFTDRDNVQGVRFYLSDADWRMGMMDQAHGRGIPVFLYPHAARPMVQYDGCVQPNPVKAMFTHAEGGAEIMKRIGYPYPVEVVGWSFSEVRPFQSVKKIESILFAPIHPNANGYLNEVDKDLNRKTLRILLKYCRETGISLSMRYIGSLADCGLSAVVAAHQGEFEMHQGKKTNSWDDIEKHDIIVSHQTFAYSAVALGVPTVMMGEDVAPRSGNSEAGFRYVDHWEDYREYLMFPLDILNGDPAKVLKTAAKGSKAVEDWKKRFIGEPFDGSAFVEKLESYL